MGSSTPGMTLVFERHREGGAGGACEVGGGGEGWALAPQFQAKKTP